MVGLILGNIFWNMLSTNCRLRSPSADPKLFMMRRAWLEYLC